MILRKHSVIEEEKRTIVLVNVKKKVKLLEENVFKGRMNQREQKTLPSTQTTEEQSGKR